MRPASPRVPDGNDVPVQPVLLALSAVLLPILLTAAYALYLRPDVGSAHFAWPIGPVLSSMMLGATYLGGASFFVIVLLTRRWRHVRLGFLPIAGFAATMGIATLLHWGAFEHERWAFWVWAALYFGVPVLLPVLWQRNRRLAQGVPLEREAELAPAARALFGAFGAVMTIAALVLLLAPGVMIATWPWTLSLLTARVMSALFILPGLVGVSVAVDGSWAAARYLLVVLALTVLLMLGALVTARADVDWAAPTSWLFTGGLLGILLLIAYARSSVRT